LSIAIQVAGSCEKLCLFWKSIRDAPEEVDLIVEDLKYLASVMQDMLAMSDLPLSSSALILCQKRIEVWW